MGSVEDLERLAALHARGELTDAEFAAVKRAAIESASGGAARAREPAGARTTPTDAWAGTRSRARLVLLTGSALALLVAAVAAFAVSRSGTETGARVSEQGSASPMTTSVESTTAAPSTTSLPTSFAVTPCPTEYGVEGLKSPRTPGTVSAVLPTEVSSRLGFYSNGRLTVLAPKAWTCSALLAANGSAYLSVYPPGAADPADYNATDGRGVVARSDWLEHAPGAGLVCAYFPGSAAVQIMESVGGCPALPAGVAVTHPASGLATFVTPDDEYGVVLYPQGPGAAVTLAKETCRLDEADSAALCPFVTEDFADRWPTNGL